MAVCDTGFSSDGKWLRHAHSIRERLDQVCSTGKQRGTCHYHRIVLEAYNHLCQVLIAQAWALDGGSASFLQTDSVTALGLVFSHL